MGKYTGVFRFRVSPEDEELLEAKATERGVSKADWVREMCGLETKKAPSLAPAAETQAVFASSPPPSPDAGPGESAMARLGERTRERLAA